MSLAEEHKKNGNTAFAASKFEEAIGHFTKAIELDPKNHVLYSNRSAAFTSLKRYEEALKDAQTTIDLNTSWPKGYSRKGAALHGLRRLNDAITTYRKALELEPNNSATKQALLEVEREQVENESGMKPEQLFGQLFQGDVLAKARQNPKTAAFTNQPDFIQMVTQLQQNPSKLQQYIGDPRISALLGVLLGVGTDGPSPFEQDDSKQEEEYRKKKEQQEQEEKKKKEEEEKKKKESSMTLTQREAELAKNEGNEHYKKKEFVAALKCYDRAIQADPNNPALYLNRAAAYFEDGKIDECIKECEITLEKGKEAKADFAFFGKAYGRMGNAFAKKNMLDRAIECYNLSLTNHRTPDVAKQLQKIEKIKEEETKKVYIDPIKSAEAKERGNAKFKGGNYPEALKEYEEAIKRNPDDHTNYSNRAACYMKLAAFDQGIKDCDECIARKPDFVKAYIRKGIMQCSKKEFNQAIQTFDQGLKYDPNNTELKEGLQKAMMGVEQAEANLSEEERMKNAMKSPEVQEILSDPVMRQILSQMTTDPSAARDHLKNPIIAEKINRLAKAGVLGIRNQ